MLDPVGTGIDLVRVYINKKSTVGGSFVYVDLPGIEPGTRLCESRGIPFTYRPRYKLRESYQKIGEKKGNG